MQRRQRRAGRQSTPLAPGVAVAGCSSSASRSPTRPGNSRRRSTELLSVPRTGAGRGQQQLVALDLTTPGRERPHAPDRPHAFGLRACGWCAPAARRRRHAVLLRRRHRHGLPVRQQRRGRTRLRQLAERGRRECSATGRPATRGPPTRSCCTARRCRTARRCTSRARERRLPPACRSATACAASHRRFDAPATVVRRATGNTASHSPVRPGIRRSRARTRVPEPGATRTYQIWYRNAAAFCTAYLQPGERLEISW